MTHIVILLCIGTACGIAAKRLKLPGGSLLGAIVGTGTYSLLTTSHPMPEHFRSAALVLLGISLGTAFNREVLWNARTKLPVVLGMIVIFVAASFALGFALHQFAPAEVQSVSTVLGCLPGGASCTMALASDFGADINIVAALHILRQVIVFATLPLILSVLARKSKSA